MESITFTEETDHGISTSRLSLDQAFAIHKRYPDEIHIEFPTIVRPDECVFRSYGIIGILPMQDLCIRIEPKVPVSNVFAMLEYAYDLRSFKFLEGLVDVKSLEDIYERLAALLARLVLNRARKGLYRNYVRENDLLPYLRGRCDLVRTFRNSMRGAIRLECEFEENTADLEDNRILAWTLYQIPRTSMMGDDTKRLVKKAYRSVAGAVRVISVDASACDRRLYHRLNEDYRPMHALCRFFLEQSGPGFEYGRSAILPFRLNMRYLFEGFVAQWLRTHAPDWISVEIQNASLLGGVFEIKLDILLRDKRTGRVLAVIDTKYKRSERPSNADIEQIVTYALHCETRNAILVYPSPLTNLYDITVDPRGEIAVRSMIFDIGGDIEKEGERFLESLLGCIQE